MSSPFPGMNPFLEQEDVWSDFHGRFIPAAAEEIGKQVRPAYIVKIDRNVYVHELPEGERRLLGRPDIYVAEGAKEAGPVTSSSATLAAPARAQLVPLTITERQGFIEIRDGVNRSLITAIELLSPANKEHGSDRDQYLAKRNRYLDTGVHLVEIDLLRGGPRLPLHPPPKGDYCVMVSRAEERPNVDCWPIRLRDALPAIPIPLRAADGSVPLNLQAVVHRVYDAAGYGDYIYKFDPNPRLSPDDQRWAAGVLKDHGA
ncbi:MAG: DUF4058 family protein [Planctomycetaceae bacterium]|nr:DUF4058 family protein [Planctomycetaceae bacterium]